MVAGLVVQLKLLITKVCSQVFWSTWWPGWWSGWHETSEDQWLWVPAKMAGTGFGCHYITYVLYFSVFLSLHHLCTVFLCISVTTSPIYCTSLTTPPMYWISLFLYFITVAWSHTVYIYLHLTAYQSRVYLYFTTMLHWNIWDDAHFSQIFVRKVRTSVSQ